MNHKVSLIIVTKNRSQYVRKLIKSINHQSVLPHQLIIVDDIDGSPALPSSILKLVDRKVLVNYYQVKFSSISRSRNFAFDKCKSSIFISLDDDITIPKQYIETIIKLIKKYPTYIGFATKIISLHQDAISLISQNTMNGRSQNLELVPFIPTAAYTLNWRLFQKLGINFDEKLPTGEDMDFFLRLYNSHHPICFSTDTYAIHDFHSHQNSLSRHLNYGRDFLKLSLKHPLDLNYTWCLPQRKLDFIFFPLFFIKTVFRLVSQLYQFSYTPFKYLPQVIAIKTANLVGIYTSQEGRMLTRKYFCQSFPFFHLP